ncbi:MAG: Pirin domain protein [Phenylobacterium sp.]|nr:Pirin domain protein [Phenylobacterium sp.]
MTQANPATGAALVAPPAEPPRWVIHRTRGRRHGPLTRLMSPGDLGELLKPFVFLDLFDMDAAAFSAFGLHPHSGIETVTYLFEGNVRYEDTTGETGILPEGGVEWFKAGGGAWHGGGTGDSGRARGFQLWIALPPELEHSPAQSVYQAPGDVALDGPAAVLLGSHGGATSPLEAPAPMTYLAVRLKAGETWRFQPGCDHNLAWAAVARGRLTGPERVDAGELVIFQPSNAAIDFQAEVDTEFVVGSAARHPHDLVLGYYSVHTSPAALAAGERRIGEIQTRLQREGRLPA